MKQSLSSLNKQLLICKSEADASLVKNVQYRNTAHPKSALVYWVRYKALMHYYVYLQTKIIKKQKQIASQNTN